MEQILIETIRTDGAVQSRAAINPEYVAELAELVKAGAKLPPVEVYRAAGETWMADGFHRLRAHEAAGARTIRANCHKGGRDEAAWHSAGANVQHGLRRTNADKRRAVEMALKLKPSSSDRLIADHVGVSHTFVSSARLQLATVASSTGGQVATVATSTRTGADGKTYKLPPPPPPPPPKQPVAVELVTPQPEPARAARTPPPAAKEPMLDQIGKAIPDHLEGLFERGQGTVQRCLDLISSIRGTIRSAEDDPLWAECNRQSAEAGLSQAYDAIKATIPYAVCPWCGGQDPMQAGCRGCAGRGAIGKFRYDNMVPAELKAAKK